MSDRDSRIKLFGSEDDWEDPADAAPPTKTTGAIDLHHMMKPVRLSLDAINQASRIIPDYVWKNRGLVTWLQLAADDAFSKLKYDELAIIIPPSPVAYFFELDHDAPVLVKVQIGLKTKRS